MLIFLGNVIFYTRVAQISVIICKYTKSFDVLSESEIITFQHNLSVLRYNCASGLEACGSRTGQSVLVASVATPGHSVSLPHYCKTSFHPDAPLGGRKCDSLREQSPDYMEDEVERSISVSGWCPLWEQPGVDGRYPGEVTLIFALFFSYSRCSFQLLKL
jgi:hypothetical protein